jgi:hypothetical protein
VGFTGLGLASTAQLFVLLSSSNRSDAIWLAIGGAMLLLAYPYLFGELCQSVYLQYGGFAGVPSNADWTMFAYSWFWE